jgi:signal transduction histidine kinase
MPSAKPPLAPASLPTSTDAIPLHRRLVDLPSLARSTLEPLEREAQGLDVELKVEAPAGGLEPVLVDPEKLAWVIATLVGNALRYVRRGTRRLPGGSVVVRIRQDGAAKQLSIAIEDDGPGIPSEKVPYLFERQAGSQHAIGLALTLVHDIIAAHGGRVDLKTDTGRLAHGTTVSLTLPMVGPPG